MPHINSPVNSSLGRNMRSCMDAWNALRSSPTPTYLSGPPVSNAPHKRKSPAEPAESFSPAHPPKRRQSASDTTAGTQRVIQPKPSANGQSPPLFSLPQPGQPKKRGRPSKAEVEARNADLVARGYALPPSKTPTPRSKPPELAPREPESMAHRDAIFPERFTAVSFVPPGTSEAPVSEPIIPFDTRLVAGPVDSEASDQSGKKRGRGPSKPPQRDANPSEGNPPPIVGARSQLGEFDSRPPATYQAQILAPRPLERAGPATIHTPAHQTAPPAEAEVREVAGPRPPTGI
jgi:hypothetical protein